jgi:hypothetical protein
VAEGRGPEPRIDADEQHSQVLAHAIAEARGYHGWHPGCHRHDPHCAIVNLPPQSCNLHSSII